MLRAGERVHLVGIGGAGMSAIAKVLLEMGCRVSGSDIELTDATNRLAELGAVVHQGHRAEQIEDVHRVVVSTATAANNPEVEAARQRGLPIQHRSEILAALLNDRDGIAVTGAYGKTTITAMIAWILVQGGLSPTYLIGGELPGLGRAAFGPGRFVVAEADESDRSFLRYRPHLAVVTSIEADLLQYYDDDLNRMIQAFREFLENVKPGGQAILGVDDPRVAQIAPTLRCRVLSYGLSPGAELTARQIALQESMTRFEAWRGEERLGQAQLMIPGRYNVQNALAAIGVGLEAGLPFEQIAEGLAAFRGPRRRFEVVGEVNGILVVDDYAHMPSKIKASIRAAREGWRRRVVAVFQPHRYIRTYYLMDDLATAFSDADVIVLTDIYAPPPDQPIEGVTGRRLADAVARHERGRVHFCEDWPDAVDCLMGIVRPGDVVLTMGAGNIGKAAHELVRRLRPAEAEAGGA